MNKSIIIFLFAIAISILTVTSTKVRRQSDFVDGSGSWTTFDNFPKSSVTSSQEARSSYFSDDDGGDIGGSSSYNRTSEETASLVSRLLQASTELDRIGILDRDSDWAFNFFDPPANSTSAAGNGGKTIKADRANFPALIGNGMAMTLSFLGPCGFNTPHIHPRASEMVYVVNGTVEVGFIAENGARQVQNSLVAGSMTIIPQAAIHWQTNLGCAPVLTVAAFNHENPGVSQVAQNFFRIDQDALSATLGGVSTEFLEKTSSKIPRNIALGIEECLKRCGISRETNTQNSN